MNLKVQNSKFKMQNLLRAVLFILLIVNCAPAQNDLQRIEDGGFVRNWLISNEFPAEIDAGAWENFNRFNIETLPQKDWLAPFGGVPKIKPSVGTFQATIQNQPPQNPKSKIQNPKSNEPLPEVGAASNIKILPDATEINWREFKAENSRIDFYNLFGGKTIGTAYAASYVNSRNDETRFVETDGFTGAIWLNGEKIYDGYSLNIKKTGAAKFNKGANLLIVRASGISGDYWRKDGAWTATIRFWKSEADAIRSAEYKSTGAAGTIFYLEGFHVDPVYLQDQRGYSRITLSNTNQYVNNLRADARYGVFLSEIDYLKPYLDTHPEDREFLRQTVKDGRVGTGGAYNQFNELTIGGESIIRNILYGQAMHEAMLGRRAKSLALWDVFGHAPQISQIAAKSGFNGIAWSKKITGFEPFFYDYALDGSRLLHRRVDYAYSFSGFGSGKNYTLDNFRQMTERKFAETQTFNSAIDLRINAADFTPPWTNLAGNVEKLETNKPQIKVTGQAQDFYFDALKKEIADGKLKPPVTSRDKLFFHVGVMAARSDLKIGQRLSENMTLTAEKFGAIAYLRGAKYPDLALDKAWRQIFFGSHHDAITGTPSDSAFLDLVHGYREAFELSKDALDDSLEFIAKQINTKPKVRNLQSKVLPVIVFNPMSWTRNDVVKAKIDFVEPDFGYDLIDEKGAVVKFQLSETEDTDSQNSRNTNIREIKFIAENVPSLGYKTYYFKPNKFALMEFGGLSSNSNRKIIANEFYTITVDANKGGAISSIYDKQAKREIINTANGHFANEIAALREELTKKNVIYPAWEFWTTGEKKFSTEKAARVVSHPLANNGRAIIIEGELPNMQKYRQTIELHKGIKRIDFKTELVDYIGRDELFVVNFPLNLSGGALVTEDRFGSVVRNNSKGFLDFRTNTDKLVSGAPVYAVNNWAEYGSTFDLNFVDAGGKLIASIPFKPTALVRPHGENYASLTETVVSNLINRGVSATPFYDDNDQTRRKNLSIEDSTMPKKLNDDIAYHNFRIALGGERENLYSATLLKQVSAETRAKFDARLQRDGFAYLFLYDKDLPKDSSPIPTLLIAGNLEKAIERFTVPNTFEINLPFESFAVETNPAKDLPRVPDYGVALINNGTPAVSLENPDTLTLFLTHTAIFPGVNLPFDFVPENKTHVFKYALYPHAEGWREADTVKVGEDFNNPLIAIQTDVHNGDLPGEHSFLKFDSDERDNIVLSAFKVGENPQADFKTKTLENRRKLIVRFNETQGRKSPLFFTFAPRPPSKNDSNFHDVFWRFRKTNLLEVETPDAEVGRSTNLARASFRTAIDGFGIETFSLNIDGQVEKKDSNNRENLGAVKEIVQPIFSRYWLHNSGAAPIGNDAVKVSLRPVEQMNELSTFAYDDKYNQGGTTTVAVRVQVVNNYQDRSYKGEVALEVPEDWRVVPDKLSFDIAPNGSFVKDVVIVGFPVKKDLEFERASGLVKARIEHEGQIYQDVLNLGKPFNLEWRTEKSAEGAVTVKIKNPHRQTIEGAVALIAPPEAWAGGIYSSEPNFPRELGFAVAPDAEIALVFETGNLPSGAWTIARIAYNGFVDYKRADAPTQTQK
ncbi:MAG: GH38 [uncultured Pyrinomonadaceae bacterium]|uniref:GH38 n=1 Tax=uncultured Pyrinomonadaceae bacterium TaxID=2283094 RepID=A0A6J4Q6M7_9BACT|nr:MAG: GH38 [uncultured Pyrinomonadaceae bacterium]